MCKYKEASEEVCLLLLIIGREVCSWECSFYKKRKLCSHNNAQSPLSVHCGSHRYLQATVHPCVHTTVEAEGGIECSRCHRSERYQAAITHTHTQSLLHTTLCCLSGGVEMADGLTDSLSGLEQQGQGRNLCKQESVSGIWEKCWSVELLTRV